MANKNFKDILTKAGTTAAFAVAMTAALAIPANADEIDENVTPPVENPPVQEPAPVEKSSDVKEVKEHNEAVKSSNESKASGNESSAAKNESTASKNESSAAKNESTVSKNESTETKNESVDSKNESSVAKNESTVSKNESTETKNESADAKNEGATSSNESVDKTNQETITENAGKIEDNENLTQDLPAAPETIETPDLPDVPDAPDPIETPDLPDISDVPETPDPEEKDTEGYNEQVGDHNDQVDDYNDKVDETNGKVEDYNEKVDGYNDKVNEANDQIKDYNEKAEDYSGNVDEYNAKVDEANGQIKDYNEKAEDYNEKVDEYNKKVDEYNTAVDGINRELEDQHEQAMGEWKADDQAAKDYKAEEAAHIAKEKAFAAYEDAIAAMNEAYAALGEDPTEEELAAYEAAIAAAKDTYAKDHAAVTEYADGLNAYAANLEEKRIYAQNKKEYDDKVAQDGTRQEIYEEVQEYNEGIKNGNAAIEEANKALEDGIHANVEDTLEEVAASNAAVNEAFVKDIENGAEILETLSEKNRTALKEKTDALAKTAAALKAEGEKKYELGTPEYAAYLEDVKSYNTAVAELNAKLAEYNNAVKTYNDYVDGFNAKPAESTTSTGGGTQQEEGKDIDWGNVKFETYGDILTHMDVKYNAAASKTVTTGADGKPSYSDTVTQYTVDGVYAELGDSGYGLAYSNDGWKTSTEQVLNKDADNDEFGNTLNNHLGENLDPVNGEIRFHVTLKDSANNTHIITVDLDAESVYAEGSYYKPEANDFLKDFRYLDEAGNVILDKDGNPVGLPTEKIDGVEYYDISGQPVFLISALVCDGMTNGKWVQDNWWTGHYENQGTLYAHGLDLILNLQTMIDIHKADNAMKITYQGYQLGMLAAAEAPGGGPGSEPGKPGDVELLEGPGKFDGTDPGDPGEAPTLVKLDKLSHIEKKLDTLEELKRIEEKLDTLEEMGTLEELNPIEELNKLDYKMILEIPEEIPEEEPVWFNDDVVIVEALPEAEELNWFDMGGGLVNLPDEEVPLADVPLTGDTSLLFGMSSLFSLAGLYLTGKKRRNRT